MKKQHGFTLIELAIVLVIIGLIIGGIIIGRDLIRVAQLNAVASEVAQYTQAITDFREKYHALPGDFSGATAFWGAANATPSICWSTIGTSTQTCDGNGDGRISIQCGPPCYTVAAQYEQFRAWQHLVNAGMIDGSYTGVNGSFGPQNAIPGVNVPASKLPGAGYMVTSFTAP